MPTYDLTNNKISETYGRVVQMVSGSYYDGFGNVLPIGTSSVVITASTANFATTGSNTFIGNQTVSGSVIVTNGITGSLLGTSSYSLNTISSSYAVTASYSDYAATAGLSQNAQDILIYVKNTSGAIIPKGKVVRITGVDNSANFGTIALADYSNDANSANTLGFTNESFAINAFGYVMTEGYLLGVNTDGFTSGDLLFLSSSGTYTNVTPVAPKHGVRLGQVIRVQLINGSIYVNIDNGAELGELHDVVDSTTTGSYGDLLVKSGSIWVNSKNLTGSYTLSGSLTTNNAIIANSITSSLYGTSSWSINTINVNGGYVTASGIFTNGNIIPSSPGISLGTVDFPFESISISSGSLIIASDVPTISASVISNNNGNLEISSGGIKLIQPNSSFIAPTASFSYLSSSFKQVGDRTLIGNDIISGSIQITNGVTGSLQGTSSWANNVISASYALTASYSDVAASSISSQTTQELLLYVKNTSGAIIPKGKVVKITSTDSNASFATIALADYSNNNNSANTLGFTNESFAINAFGYVVTEGYLTGINTNDFTSGDILYLSSSGTYTNIEPVAPKYYVRLGEVVRVQLVNGGIYVRIDNGYELSELHNILDTSTTSSYGDLLVKSGSIWINSKNLTGSYTLSGSLTTNDGIIATSVSASLYGTSSWSNNSLTASYAILTNVSMSLNFVNDTAAAAGGVPLGGLYRNGNAVLIRIV